MSCPSVRPPDAEYEGPIAKVFMLILQTLLLKMKKIGDATEYPSDYSSELKQGKFDVSFDFILIGGGTAGTILANRLTQNPQWNVLVLEAGGIPSKTSEVPLLQPTLRNSQEDWAYQTEQQEAICQGMQSGCCSIFQGKVLGGTSTTFSMHYGRATRDDWSEMEQFNETWGYDLVLPYYKRLENFSSGTTLDYPMEYGKGGPIPLKIHPEENQWKKIILSLAEEYSLGKMKKSEPFLGYLETAVILEGTRKNFAKIYLNPIKTRKNLFISLNTSAERILVTPSPDLKANGVVANIGGTTVELRAKREVIITAGTISTPKLLMASGIGPKEHLETHNIEVLNDLPVGKNLQSHYMVPVFVGVDDGTPEDDLTYLDGVFNLLVHQKGVLGGFGISTLIDYVTNRIAVHHQYIPRNDEIFLSVVNHSLRYCHHIVHSLKKQNKKQAILVFSLVLTKPESRGCVELTGTEPCLPPKVNNNYFSQPKDSEELVLAYKYLTQLVKSPKLVEYKARLLKLEIPACRCFRFLTDGYIDCYVRNMGFPTSVVGTAKIGSACDGTSVVNEELIVHGFRCLRVVDASVLPNITTVNPLGTVAMIAERASDLIKLKWNKPVDNSTSEECPEVLIVN